jgi:hypothetical protein
MMRNVTLLKGNKLAACFETQLIFVSFFIWLQKMSQHIVFNLVFNEDSKMGSAIFLYLLYFKSYCKKYNFCEV